MSDSVYYKATDEDGNTVLKHSWKKHKYLYIKNGKYVYPEDVKKSSAMRAQKAQKHYTFKDKQVSETGTPTSWVKQGPVQQKKHVEMERRKKANPYKGPTDAIQAQKAQHEKDFQKRVRAMNAHTVAKKNADMLKKKQDRQMKQIAANVKKQNAPSTKVKKAAKFATKVATRDAAAKMAAAKYLVSKAAKSPTANATRAKARSVVSKGEYKITRAGQKLSNDARPYISSAKKKYNSVSKDVNKAYKSAKKKINSVSRDANKAYKAAKKKVRKARNTFNRAKRAGKAYLNYLTK